MSTQLGFPCVLTKTEGERDRVRQRQTATKRDTELEIEKVKAERQRLRNMDTSHLETRWPQRARIKSVNQRVPLLSVR